MMPLSENMFGIRYNPLDFEGTRPVGTIFPAPPYGGSINNSVLISESIIQIINLQAGTISIVVRSVIRGRR